ncbi:MAG: glycosyltransferase, partial [Terracidiphilus sp.]
MKIWFPRNWLEFREDGDDARIANKILSNAFGRNPWFWICAWPLLHAPLSVSRFWARVLSAIARIRIERLSRISTIHSQAAHSASGICSRLNDGADERRRVAAIVVLYHPDLVLLERLLKSAAQQVDHILVVDNTPNPTSDLSRFLKHFGAQATYEPLGDNMGIATAQNVGISKLQGGFSHVLLLDQDSDPHPDMVKELMDGERGLIESGKRVAA